MRLSFTKEKEIALLQIFGIFVVPVLLLRFHIVPIDWRVPMIIVIACIIYMIIHKEGWQNADLGMVWPTRQIVFRYAFWTLIAMVVCLTLPPLFGFHFTPHIFRTHVWWFLPLCLAQEFIFRSFLFPLLTHLFREADVRIFMNVCLFAFMHMIYPGLGIMLPVAVGAGVFFAILYYRYPNFWLISLSHAVLNLLIVSLGFFNIPS